MYAFKKAVCLGRTIGSQWHDVDLSNILVYDIFATYLKVYLSLSNPLIDGDIFVDLDTLRAEYSSYNDTLNNLLVELGDRSLATVEKLPTTDVKYAKYSDAYLSEYKVDITKIGVVTASNYPASELKDLVVTRPKYNTDMSLLHSHCLVSVNGFYHMTDTDGSKAYVYDGGTSMRKSGNNNLGILSFYDVGGLKKVKLDKSRIVSGGDGSTLKEKIYFTVDEELDGKCYILVLGGYLVIPEDGVFWRNSENGFALDLSKLPYMERIYESEGYLDLDGLGLSKQSINDKAINVAELWSDEVIKRYMTLSQSYLVIVDTPYIATKKLHIRHSNLPGMFTSSSDPVYPLCVGYGRTVEYWKVLEDDVWSVTVQDSFMRNYVLSWQSDSTLRNVTDQLVPNRPFWHSRGYMLEIAGYKL